MIGRVAERGSLIGCCGLLVHAENERARGFYLHLIPGLEASPTDPLHLRLRMKDIRLSLSNDAGASQL